MHREASVVFIAVDGCSDFRTIFVLSSVTRVEGGSVCTGRVFAERYGPEIGGSSFILMLRSNRVFAGFAGAA